MYNKISRISSLAVPQPSRAAYGPSSAGLEFDSSTGLLVVNPNGTRRYISGEFQGTIAPVNGTSGTYAGMAPLNALYLRTTTGDRYRNTNTLASPTWVLTATGTESGALSGVTAGTVSASKAIVVNSVKSFDVSQVTTSRTIGGTGVPATATVETEFTKAVTGIADATATTVLTLTCPNSVQAGVIEVSVVAKLGAGGAIGAGEAVATSKYTFGYVRTAGVASVCTAATVHSAVAVAVVGAATVTGVLTVTATGEGVGLANTHLIKVTITKSGGSSAAHTCDVFARILNSNTSGSTLA